MTSLDNGLGSAFGIGLIRGKNNPLALDTVMEVGSIANDCNIIVCVVQTLLKDDILAVLPFSTSIATTALVQALYASRITVHRSESRLVHCIINLFG